MKKKKKASPIIFPRGRGIREKKKTPRGKDKERLDL